ncbi:MAG TPA: hypothetical protein DDW81_01765 [Cryomorphaceae bacterium]|nr:hypothetical protein [Owenweeksia sp.]HBF18789.1 hypothetical protein [Cryomorphaceae bacterium]|tara:strand:- start:241 stop:1473 length:1233 start_codon:yes stop_codon:yes gene_type:complete
MESISSKINSFLEEHSLDLDKIDYVRLFIENAGELISLGRDCFQDLEGVFQYDNDFEAKLWACHQNAFFGNEITNYYYLRYYWEKRNGLIVPGYLDQSDITDSVYVQIAVINLKMHWFEGEQFCYQKNILDRVNWSAIHHTQLEYVYDEVHSGQVWGTVMAELKKLDKGWRYQRFIEELEEAESIFKAPRSLDQYLADRDKWERRYGKSLPYPINKVDLDQIGPDLLDQRVEEETNFIQDLQMQSSDQLLTLREYLSEQERKYLSNNGSGFNRELYLKRLNPNFTQDIDKPILLDRFDKIINELVTARIRDKYDFLTKENIFLIDAPNTNVDELALIANLMVVAGLFQNVNKAYSFLSRQFRVKHRKNGSLYSPSSDSMRKAFNTIRNSTTQKRWKELRNKFESFLTTQE